MASVQLSTAEQRRLADLVARRAGVMTPMERQNLLDRAGLSAFAYRLDLNGDARTFSWQLIRELQQWGTLEETGRPALEALLDVLKDAVGGGDDAALVAHLLNASQASGGEAQSIAPAPSVTRSADRVTVLFMASNPQRTTSLRLGEEVRTIKERLREAALRDRFELEQEHAVRWPDVSRHLLDSNPHVVHFAGHGEMGGELVFENEGGQPWSVPRAAVGETFRILKDDVRCVVLNACWSEGQAAAIVEHIDFVVGMSRPVPDDAAIRFAAGFYRGLGYGRSLQDAFDLGKVEMATAPPSGVGRDIAPADGGLDDLGPERLEEIPRLLCRPNMDPTSTALVRR